jgi:hypothetical protein
MMLPAAWRMLMTSPAVLKLPLPDDKAEALALAGGRSRDASRGSPAHAVLSTFIVFPLLSESTVPERT